jgi:hypothetical protein
LDSGLQTVDRIDRAEAFIAATSGEVAGLGENPSIVRVTHRFTPGLYGRECWMPEGAVIVSKVHRTEHQFVVSAGHVLVYSDADQVQDIRAPYTGITKPGTRRVLVCLEDTTWTTFHPTDLTDPVEIERQIIEPHDNPLLAGVALRNLPEGL